MFPIPMDVLINFIWLMALVVVIIFLVFFITYITNPVRKVIKNLNGRMNFLGKGVLSFYGRDVVVRYNPGSHESSPELSIYTYGNFGVDLLIRHETKCDTHFKKIGLNQEVQIADSEVNDRLYFECDDKEFLHRLFLNSKAKEKTYEILKCFSHICITKNRCLFKKYPAGLPTKSNLESWSKSLLEFSSLIPGSNGNNPTMTMFKAKSAVLIILGLLVLLAGFAYCVQAFVFYYIIVDDLRLWDFSLTWTILLTGIVGFISFHWIKGSSLSSKVFFPFILMFFIGAILCGRFGTAVYNANQDKSESKTFTVFVRDKYISRSEDYETYHVLVEPWKKGQTFWKMVIPEKSMYDRIIPGRSQFQITTKAGKLGFEWLVSQRLIQ